MCITRSNVSKKNITQSKNAPSLLGSDMKHLATRDKMVQVRLLSIGWPRLIMKSIRLDTSHLMASHAGSRSSLGFEANTWKPLCPQGLHNWMKPLQYQHMPAMSLVWRSTKCLWCLTLIWSTYGLDFGQYCLRHHPHVLLLIVVSRASHPWSVLQRLWSLGPSLCI
jgi:hypothetical protein